MTPEIAMTVQLLPFVLVCQTCGTPQEVPVLPRPRTDDPWLRCIKHECKSTKFSLRTRTPLVKSEPHP